MQLYMKILIISSIITVSSLLFFYAAFPQIFKAIVRYQTSLRKGNLMRRYYLKLPIPLDFRVYFFNITNPDQVQQGEMPDLMEIGPYCYDAYKEKIDVVDNKDADTLTYTPYETYFFNQEHSGELSQDDYVTILNPLTGAMVASVAKTQPALLKTVNKALNSIFNNPQSIYLTVKVRDILFDGIIINCTVKDFPGKAACAQIKSQLSGLIEKEPKVYLFSIFGPRNGTLPQRVEIMRGARNSADLGRLVSLNNQSKLKIWSTDECNEYHGTDGWIFPPFLHKIDQIWAYSPDLCRNVYMSYNESLKVHGLHTRRYEGTLGDQSSNPEDQCYCSTPKKCLPKGVFDLTKCLGAPIYATLPHFYETDPMFLEKVKGLQPAHDNHSLFANFEPTLGVPVEARKRMQLNLEIQPLEKISFMKTVPEVLHPIFWIEEGVVLEGNLLKMVTSVFTLLQVMEVLKYLMLVGGLIGCAVGGSLYYRNQQSATITPFSSKSTSDKTVTDSIQLNNNNNNNKMGGEINYAMNNHQPDN